MPAYIDNIAGISTSTGAGNPVISSDIDSYDSFDNLPDTTAAAFKMYRTDGINEWVLFRATWAAGTNTLTVTATGKSSAGVGVFPTFTAGTKRVVLISDAAMLADAAASAELSALSAGTQPDGTEIMPAEQSGNAVKLTIDQVGGDHVVGAIAHARNTKRTFCDLTGQPQGYEAATDNSIFGSDPAVAWFSGTGAVVRQDGGLITVLRYGAALCKAGSTASGRAAITSTFGPVYFADTTNIMRGSVLCKVTAAPSASQDFDAQVGLMSIPTAVADNGIFFRCSNTDGANWQAVTADSNGAAETVTDTGIAVTNGWLTFTVEYDYNTGDATFYIDGALVATQSTNLPYLLKVLYFGAAIFKTAGTTDRQIWVDVFAYTTTENGTPTCQYF